MSGAESAGEQATLEGGRGRSPLRALWIPVWFTVNMALGYVSHLPLVMFAVVVRHVTGFSRDHDPDGHLLAVFLFAVWAVTVLPVFGLLNAALERRMPLPRPIAWTGAVALLLVLFVAEFVTPPGALGFLFSWMRG